MSLGAVAKSECALASVLTEGIIRPATCSLVTLACRPNLAISPERTRPAALAAVFCPATGTAAAVEFPRCFNPRSPLSPAGRPRGESSAAQLVLARCALTHTSPRFSALGRCVPPAGTRSALFKPSGARPGPCAAPGPARSLITTVSGFLSSSPHPTPGPTLLPPRFPGSLPLPARSARLAPPRSLGSRDGGPVRQAQPLPHGHLPDPEAEGASGSRAPPLLAPPCAGPGLVLACPASCWPWLAGERASLFAQVRPGCTPSLGLCQHLMGPVGRYGKGARKVGGG